MARFFIQFSDRERPLTAVPLHILLVLLVGFSAQLVWHGYGEGPVARVREMPGVPEQAAVRLLSLDDRIAMSKVLMLWLQAFDNQPGISIPFRKLDYDRTIEWLDLILGLDPRAQYPLLAASRLYTLVPDDTRKRKMLDFVARKFIEDPILRWQWMAHAVYVAKHQLHDMDLALQYARMLGQYTVNSHVPSWARQMEIYVLEDMGELESAKVLIGGLLESGTIHDANELRFLKQRLQDIETRQATVANQELPP